MQYTGQTYLVRSSFSVGETDDVGHYNVSNEVKIIASSVGAFGVTMMWSWGQCEATMMWSWGHCEAGANQREGGGWRPGVPGFHPSKC